MERAEDDSGRMASVPVKDLMRCCGRSSRIFSREQVCLGEGCTSESGTCNGAAQETSGLFQRGRLLWREFWGAAGAHFASCEVADAGLCGLARGLFRSVPPTGAFDVSGMGGNSEKVEGHAGCKELRDLLHRCWK